MALTGLEVPVQPTPMRPPVNGLLQSVDRVEHDPGDERWLGGERAFLPNNTALDLYDLCSNDGLSPVALPTGNTHGTGTWPAFAVMSRDECSAFGYSEGNYEERARAVLAVKEGWAVERQLEQNVLGVSSFHPLAESDATTSLVVGGVAVNPVKALFLLDQAIADANIGQGMIHALPYLVDHWAAGHMLISDRGGQLRSPQGNVIVSGNGYQGKGPDGTGVLPTDGTAGFVWAYATDLMVIDRSAQITLTPSTLGEALQRTSTVAAPPDVIRFRGDRPYAIRWSRLLHAAVKATVQHTTAP